MNTKLGITFDKGNVERVQQFLQLGFDRNCHDENGLCQLCNAVNDGNFELTKILVENGAEVNKKCCCIAPLYCAINNLDKTMVEYLIANGANTEVTFGHNGVTGLMVACKIGREAEEIAMTLLISGANPNSRDLKGYTPLMYAALSWSGSGRIIDYLVKYGADVNVVNKLKETALHMAVASSLNGDVITRIATQLGDVNGTDILGRTALFILCSLGEAADCKMVDMLLGLKADVVIVKTTKNGWTPLMAACNSGCNENVLKMLVEKGSNVNATNYLGFTPLMLTCKEAQPEQVKLLIDNGADLNMANKMGKTALSIHCSGNRRRSRRKDPLKVAKLLIENGANVNVSSDYPLMRAIKCRDLPMTNFLLDYGATVRLENSVNLIEIAIDSIQYNLDDLPFLLKRLHFWGSDLSNECLAKLLRKFQNQTIETLFQSIIPINSNVHLIKSTSSDAVFGRIGRNSRNRIFLMKSFMENRQVQEHLCHYLEVS